MSSGEGEQVGADAGGGSMRGEGGGQRKSCNAADQPTDAPAPPTSAPGSLARHSAALQRLDREYSTLLSSEKTMEEYLQRLQQEEATLELALKQSSTSLKEQRETEAKRKDAEAVARLEEALMMGGDSDGEGSATG